VGCNAIQLAKAAGYEVIATASPKNHNYLKSLGAAEVFDYRSSTAVPDIIRAFRNRSAAGAVSFETGSFKACVVILGACEGNKFVAQATLGTPPFPKGALDFPPFIFGALTTVISGNIKCKTKGVGVKMINGSDLVANEVGKAIYEGFLLKALEQHKFRPAPELEVVEKGLQYVQKLWTCAKKVFLQRSW
jgi:hypothetical protein